MFERESISLLVLLYQLCSFVQELINAVGRFSTGGTKYNDNVTFVNTKLNQADSHVIYSIWLTAFSKVLARTLVLNVYSVISTKLKNIEECYCQRMNLWGKFDNLIHCTYMKESKSHSWLYYGHSHQIETWPKVRHMWLQFSSLKRW